MYDISYMRYLITTESRKFIKEYARLPLEIKLKFKDRFLLFMNEPDNRLLNKHKLHGTYEGSSSINITGDYRAILHYLSENHVEFIRIGTHGQLYEN
jgi:mRNA-degrading endonuclease YafQ of YafQ-DinJ toxin-antitoxin module